MTQDPIVTDEMVEKAHRAYENARQEWISGAGCGTGPLGYFALRAALLSARQVAVTTDYEAKARGLAFKAFEISADVDRIEDAILAALQSAHAAGLAQGDRSAFRRGAEAMREMAAQAGDDEAFRAIRADFSALQVGARVKRAVLALPLPEAPPSRDDATAASEALRVATDGLRALVAACDAGRRLERGAGGMTIEAQIRRTVINGVSARSVEEARKALAAIDAIAKGGA